MKVAVVGDRVAKFVAQDSIEDALQHSAAVLGTSVEVEWFPTPTLEHGADEQLAHADAVWPWG